MCSSKDQTETDCSESPTLPSLGSLHSFFIVAVYKAAAPVSPRSTVIAHEAEGSVDPSA